MEQTCTVIQFKSPFSIPGFKLNQVFRTRLEPVEGGGESAGSVLPPVAVGSAGGYPEADGGDDGEDEAEGRGHHASHHERHHSEK